LHGYQNKGVAGGAVWNCLKTKEIQEGKKGKTESRRGKAECRRQKAEAGRQKAEVRKDRKAGGGRI
jgi:hypothetical protein